MVRRILGRMGSRDDGADRGPRGQQATDRVKLRSLAPDYVGDEHSSYVQHLLDAVKDKRNWNIALTGRYGSGKSSVLNEFESQHEGTTHRIVIGTLGADEADENLTNRIQKELVKQIIYRAGPGTVARSRFARGEPLTRKTAFWQALAGGAVVFLLLWMSSWLSNVAGLDSDNPWLRLASGLLFVSLIVLVLWVVRWFIGDRNISQLSTMGAQLTLDRKPDTYFDLFLDEIMAFFEAVESEFVIFEDLDRFDDPQIFESLRELNTLINTSAHWRKREQPVRFIYAIKDSLFEQLGRQEPTQETRYRHENTTTDPGATQAAQDDQPGPRPPTQDRQDLAAAAVERANRTKFFELVIPIVPFISHRNARDHLVQALKDLGFEERLISRPLLDLVARHATDMRLLLNICNEFAVFCERLLWVKRPTPGMTADHLFALVAYKNFHLADFEAIPQHASSLDVLEQKHRELVPIRGLQAKIRDLRTTEERRRTQDETAKILGPRLQAYRKTLQNAHIFTLFVIDGETYQADATAGATFWRHLAEARKLQIASQHRQNGSHTVTAELLEGLFPEGIDPETWRESTPAELAVQVGEYNRDIASLRGADFHDLARNTRFTVEGQTFKELIDDELNSQLARDLVQRGYITRNYAEFIAPFYGRFLGPDVAFFDHHSVQLNQMYVDYQFTTPNAVRNLLEQVPDDFTSSVSVLNIDIVTYLVNSAPDSAAEVAEFLVKDHSDDARTFLDAFLNTEEAPREQFVALLAAQPWRNVFDFLSSHHGIPDRAARISLFDAALRAAHTVDEYDVNVQSASLLVEAHNQMRAFTEDQGEEQAPTILTFIRATGLIVPDLGQLAGPLRQLVIADHRYDITADNLRVALGTTGAVDLDEVRKNDDVWEYCRASIDAYVAAVQVDTVTPGTVQGPDVLAAVISDQFETWSEDQLRTVVQMSAPSATLDSLTDVPDKTWPIILDVRKVTPALTNIITYARQHGVDTRLARFLVPEPDKPITIQIDEDVDEDQRAALAVQILNATDKLPALIRVNLASSLDLGYLLDASQLVPSDDDLLARALENNLVEDTIETFKHFISVGGWDAVEEAFAVSENVGTFIAPELVAGHVADLLGSSKVPRSLRRKVVAELDHYSAPNDAQGEDILKAAGRFALADKMQLPSDLIQRIAQASQDADAVTTLLVRAGDLEADDVIRVLTTLGPPYDALVQANGEKHDIPTGAAPKTLFRQLGQAGKIEILDKGKRFRTRL